MKKKHKILELWPEKKPKKNKKNFILKKKISKFKFFLFFFFQGMTLFKYQESKNYIFEENLLKIYPNSSQNDLENWLKMAPEKTYLRTNTLKTSRKKLKEEIRKISDVKVEENELLEDVIVMSSKNEQKSESLGGIHKPCGQILV